MDFPKCKICGELHRLGSCAQTKPRAVTRGVFAGVDIASDERGVSGHAGKERSEPDQPVSGVQISNGPPPLKRGRPTITAPRPWDSEGMSRRTWYRRKAEAAE